MRRSTLILLTGLLLGGFDLAEPGAVHAQGKAVLAREAAEYVMRKFGKEATEVGAETLTRKIEALALAHGDDAFAAVRKVGPRALRIAEEAGEHGLTSVRLMAKYGDDAVWVAANPSRLALFTKYGDDAARGMMKHGEIAEPLLTALGKPAAAALDAVSSQNARRLAILAEEGQLAAIGRTPELLGIVARFGDRAADFVWRNKGALLVGAALTAFIAKPEPFLEGTADLTKIVAETVAESAVAPLAASSREVATEAARRTNWTAVALSTVAVLGLLIGARQWRRDRATAPH